VIVLRKAEELADVTGLGIPEVDGGAQGNGEHVGIAPIEEVEVVVIKELRGIEDLQWLLGDMPGGLGGRPGIFSAILRVEDLQVVLVTITRSGGLVLEGQDLGGFEALEEVGGDVLLVPHPGGAEGGGSGGRGVVMVTMGQVEGGEVQVHGVAVGDEAIIVGRGEGRGGEGGGGEGGGEGGHLGGRGGGGREGAGGEGGRGKLLLLLLLEGLALPAGEGGVLEGGGEAVGTFDFKILSVESHFRLSLRERKKLGEIGSFEEGS
jgi:hypothetical protein